MTRASKSALAPKTHSEVEHRQACCNRGDRVDRPSHAKKARQKTYRD